MATNYKNESNGCVWFVILLALVWMLFAVSCGSSRAVVTEKTTTEVDSIDTYVHKVVEFVPDTIYLPIPAQVMERETSDTVSFLQTDYATSTAKYVDGVLTHTLENKVQNVAVPFEKPVERKDSIVYRDRKVDVMVEVPVKVEKELSRWQRWKMKLGGWAMAALSGLVLAGGGYFAVKRFSLF